MSAPESMIATRPDLNATVSASAGSGKTWLLVTRIIRLLLAGAEPGGILALTFTRKAAAEMQIRLHQRLHELAVCDDTTLVDLLDSIGAESSPETQRYARTLYETLLHSLYPVRLQTFHSFCQDILARFPLEAEIPPGFELVENTSLLEQQAWESLFAEATVAPDSPLSTSLDLLMQACDGPSNTRKSLNSMLTHRSDWWAYTEDQKAPADYAGKQLQRQLEVTPGDNPVATCFDSIIINELDEFARLLRKHDTKTNLGHATLIEDFLNNGTFDAAAFDTLRPAFLKMDGEALLQGRTSTPTLEKKLGASSVIRFLELHDKMSQLFQDIIDKQRRITALTINHAWYLAGHRFIEIFQHLKRELRSLDFQDLEWNCYRLLNSSDNALWIQYKIDQRINHFLIDEFQDTNPTQWQLLFPLLSEIAASPGQRWRTVFLVGDEKQSIYSFRRANPALQSQASSWLHDNLSAQAAPLDYSWRSSPAIINFVNRVFLQEEVRRTMPSYTAHGTHLKDLAGKVTLFPLHQAAEAPADEQARATQLRNPLLEPRPENPHTAFSDEAETIALQIQQLVSTPEHITVDEISRAVTYSDIMILIRKRTHLVYYEKALRDLRIPYIGSQRGTLLDSLEIQDLEKLLDSLITPFDNLAIAQVLKSPIFSASDKDLAALAQIRGQSHWYERLLQLAENLDKQHPLARAARLLPAWRQLADTVPVHDLLDRIYAQANIMQRYIASVSDSNKQRVQANLQRFMELSLELDSGRYPSLSHFLHYIRSLRKPDATAPDEPVADSSQSRVRLMTIHASKGLEAPVVFLADCNSGGSTSEAFSALVHWPADSRKPRRFQLLMSKDKTDRITETIQQLKAGEALREQLNLLYVALTRARQYLFISGVATAKSASGWYQLAHTAISSLLTDDASPQVYSVGQQPVASTSTVTKPEREAEASRVEALCSPVPTLPDCERMIAPSRVSPYNPTEFNALNSMDEEHGQARGTTIHRALDLLSRKNPYTQQAVLQQLAAENNFNVDDTKLKSWCQEAAEIIADERFKDIFRPPESAQAYNELALLYEMETRPVYGFIDRIVVGEKEIMLIDYKTHEQATPENIVELSEAYRQQLDLYAQGIRRIWPTHSLKQGLLFTACALLVWQDQD